MSGNQVAYKRRSVSDSKQGIDGTVLSDGCTPLRVIPDPEGGRGGRDIGLVRIVPGGSSKGDALATGVPLSRTLG